MTPRGHLVTPFYMHILRIKTPALQLRRVGLEKTRIGCCNCMSSSPSCCLTPLPKSSPSVAMRNASVNSLAFSFSWTWHFTFVSSGQHFSTTPMSKTLFLMLFTSLCLNLSLQDGHLGGREPPTHLRQNVCPHDMVTGSDIRKRHIGHSSRSILGVRYVTAVSLSSQQRRLKRFLCTPALRGPCKHAATEKKQGFPNTRPNRAAKSALQTKFPFCFKVPHWCYQYLATTYS